MDAPKPSPAKAAGSIPTRNCPVAGGPPAVPEHGLASMLSTAPDSAAARISTVSPMPKPLTPPAGRIDPASAACASLVGAPAASSAQAGSIGCPSRARSRISDFATTLADWSTTSSAPPAPSGTASAKGLVPITGRVPPTGAIEAGAWVKHSPTSPSPARRSA